MVVPLSHFLVVAGLLMVMGVFGIFMNRKNIIVIMMSIELILLAANLNFVAFSGALHDMVGQVFTMFVLTVAAADRGDLFAQSRLDRGRGRDVDEGLSAC